MANVYFDKTRVVQRNLAVHNLNEYVSRNKADVALSQEPFVYNKRIRCLNSLRGTVFSCLTLVNDLALPLFCSKDMTTARLDYRVVDRPVSKLLVSVYLPYEG